MKMREPRSNRTSRIGYERDDLAEDIAYLAQFPQKAIAGEIGMSERRWRDVARGKTKPRPSAAARIAGIAHDCRLDEGNRRQQEEDPPTTGRTSIEEPRS